MRLLNHKITFSMGKQYLMKTADCSWEEKATELTKYYDKYRGHLLNLTSDCTQQESE